MHLPSPSRTPSAASVNALLDSLIQEFALKNDACLCRELQLQPSLLSKLRHGRLRLSAHVMLNIHERYGISFAELRRRLDCTPDYPPTVPRGRPFAPRSASLAMAAAA